MYLVSFSLARYLPIAQPRAQEAVIVFAAMLTGIIVLASTFSVIGTQISSVKSSYNVFRQKLDLVQEEMEALAMPPELVFRVDQYYQYLVGLSVAGLLFCFQRNLVGFGSFECE
jgi:hypothetical protein